MIKVLEQAIEKVKGLPQDKQEYAAYVLEEIAADAAVYRLSDEERSDLTEALAEMDRGEVASVAEVAAVFQRLTA